MQVVFDCPRCLQRNAIEILPSTPSTSCRHCDWVREIDARVIATDIPQNCLCCGCEDLWRQKDFPPLVGLVMVGAGIVLSSIAVAYMRPILALGILMGFALVDMVLFAVMRDRLVCYRCHSIYRKLGKTEGHAKFNLELNERHRQEAARLNGPSGT